MTLGELKDHLLRARRRRSKRIGAALTGVMAAALAKLCDVHELIYLAQQDQAIRARRARSLGAPGTLSSRLQPNHPDRRPARRSRCCVYWGLAMGAGDALHRPQPGGRYGRQHLHARCTISTSCAARPGAPTQICVLAHVKTQLACLERGAPVEIMFQSLAGTERTNLIASSTSRVDLLDHAYRTMAEHGPLAGVAEQFMYFETGQGSEFTYGKHNGIDMTTTEALCYGLARRYDPFMVNNVTGFIGPETHLDSFEMIAGQPAGPFHGQAARPADGHGALLHAALEITLEGQQIATELADGGRAPTTTWTSISNTDRMLAYFDTSGHDDQTLREVHGLAPAPEFLEWGLRARHLRARRGRRDRCAGRTGAIRGIFCSEAEFERLRADLARRLRLRQRRAASCRRRCRARIKAEPGASAREAIHAELRRSELGGIDPSGVIATAADSKEAASELARTSARASPRRTARSCRPSEPTCRSLVSDGLWRRRCITTFRSFCRCLLDGLEQQKIAAGKPILAPYGRVKLAEALGDALAAEARHQPDRRAAGRGRARLAQPVGLPGLPA